MVETPVSNFCGLVDNSVFYPLNKAKKFLCNLADAGYEFISPYSGEIGFGVFFVGSLLLARNWDCITGQDSPLEDTVFEQ